MGQINAWLLSKILVCCLCVSVAASRQDETYGGSEGCGYGEVPLENGCACAPGYGASSAPEDYPACVPCSPGSFSQGGSSYDLRPPCQPCGHHFTSPYAAVSAEQCQCEPGYGAELLPLDETYPAGTQAKQAKKAVPSSSTQKKAVPSSSTQKKAVPSSSTHKKAVPSSSTQKAVPSSSTQQVQQQGQQKGVALGHAQQGQQQAQQQAKGSYRRRLAADMDEGSAEVGIAAKPDPKTVGHTQSTKPAGTVGNQDLTVTPHTRTIRLPAPQTPQVRYAHPPDTQDHHSPPHSQGHEERPFTREPQTIEEPPHMQPPSSTHDTEEPSHMRPPQWAGQDDEPPHIRPPQQYDSNSEPPHMRPPQQYEVHGDEPPHYEDRSEVREEPHSEPPPYQDVREDPRDDLSEEPHVEREGPDYTHEDGDQHKPRHHAAKPPKWATGEGTQDDKKPLGSPVDSSNQQQQQQQPKEVPASGNDPFKSSGKASKQPPKWATQDAKDTKPDGFKLASPDDWYNKQQQGQQQQQQQQQGTQQQQHTPAKTQYGGGQDDSYYQNPAEYQPGQQQQQQQQYEVRSEAPEPQRPWLDQQQQQQQQYQQGGVVYPPQPEKDRRDPALLLPDRPSNGQKLSKGGVIYPPQQQQQQQYQDPAAGYKPGEEGYGGYRSEQYTPPQQQYNSYSRQQAPADGQYKEQYKGADEQYKGAEDYYGRQQAPRDIDNRLFPEELPQQQQQQQQQMPLPVRPDLPGPEPRPLPQHPGVPDQYEQYREQQQYKPVRPDMPGPEPRPLPQQPRQQEQYLQYPDQPQRMYKQYPEQPAYKGDAPRYAPQEQPRDNYQPIREYNSLYHDDSYPPNYQPNYQAQPEPPVRPGPEPKQPPPVDHATWWEQQRQIAIGRRKAVRDIDTPEIRQDDKDPSTEQEPDVDNIQQDAPSSFGQPDDLQSSGPQIPEPQPPSSNAPDYYEDAPRLSPRYDVPKEQYDGIVEVYGRSWDTKVCAPCPRGFYSSAAYGYTPAKIAAPAAAAVNATAAAAAPATATVGTAALSTPATPTPAAKSGKTAAAATAVKAPAAAARTAQSLGGYDGPKPRAQLCDRCLGEDQEAGGFLTPKEGTTDPEECGCAAGHGGVGCTPCEEGYYSRGGRLANCEMCPNDGKGFTTMPSIGADDVTDCVCVPGHGFDGEACEVCPVGTWSRGYSRGPCKPCKPGMISPQGSTSPDQCEVWEWECPVGQWAPEGALSPEECKCYPGFGGVHFLSGVPCHICPPGTYSTGGNRGPCRSCGKGKTSNPGAASEHECYPIQQECPPGSVSDTEFGRLLSAKNAKSASKSDANLAGKSSPAEAAVSIASVDANGKKVRVYRQTPPEGAAKALANITATAKPKTKTQKDVKAKTKQEELYSGAWGSGGDSDGHGYDEETEKYVEEHYYAFRDYEDEEEGRCVCKPGHGSHRGSAPCHECPPGTWSSGGSVSPCQLCPGGSYSPPGSESLEQCEMPAVVCEPGMFAPMDAKSEKDCVCKAGRGGKGTPSHSCTTCPPDTFSRGGFTDPCTPCPVGTKSPRGSLDISYCHPENICPMGTWVPDSFSYYSDDDDEVLPGLLMAAASGTTTADVASVATAAAAGAAAAGDGEGTVWTSQFLGLDNPKPKKAADANKQQQQKAQSKPDSRSMDIGFIGMGGGGSSSKKAATPSPWQLMDTPGAAKPRQPNPKAPQPKAGTPRPTDSIIGGGSSSKTGGSQNSQNAFGSWPMLEDVVGGTVISGTPRDSSSSKDSRQGPSKGPSKGPSQQQQQRKQGAKGGEPQPMPVSGGMGRDGGRRYYPHRRSSWRDDTMFGDFLTKGNKSTSQYGQYGPEVKARCINKKGRDDYNLFDMLGGGGNVVWVNCTDDYGSGSNEYRHNSGDYYYGEANNTTGGDKHTQDRSYDRYGYDQYGYDREGYTREGYDQDGVDPYGFDRMGRFRGFSGDDDEKNRENASGDSGGDMPRDGASGDSRYDMPSDGASGESRYDMPSDGASGDSQYDPRDDDSSDDYSKDSREDAKRDDEYYYDMMPPQYAVAKDCTCRPGFGSKTGEEGTPCYRCAPGSYSPGNTFAPCKSCPPGYTSAPGSTHAKHCVPLFKECGTGGYLPKGSHSEEDHCHCYPGYGLETGEYGEPASCELCPPGTYSEGHSRLACKPCDADETSHAGAWRPEMCHFKSHYDTYDRAALYARHARISTKRRQQASTWAKKGKASTDSSKGKTASGQAAASKDAAAAAGSTATVKN